MLSAANSHDTGLQGQDLKDGKDDDVDYIVPATLDGNSDVYLNPNDLGSHGTDDDDDVSLDDGYTIPERAVADDYMVIPRGGRRMNQKMESAGQASIWSEGYMAMTAEEEASRRNSPYDGGLIRDDSRKPSLCLDETSKLPAPTLVVSAARLEVPTELPVVKRSNSVLSRMLSRRSKPSKRASSKRAKDGSSTMLRRRSQSFHGLPSELASLPEAGPVSLDRAQSLEQLAVDDVADQPMRHMTMDHQELLRLRSTTRRPRNVQTAIIRLPGYSTGRHVDLWV
jgi:hypothetical protein